MSDDNKKALNKVVHIGERRIQEYLGELVSVEETLNALLDAGAEAMCGAQRYVRSPYRVDTPCRRLRTDLPAQIGEVMLKMHKQTFEAAIIERYGRHEAIMGKSLTEMYLDSVSIFSYFFRRQLHAVY